MSNFIAIDCNADSEWYSTCASWGYDLICARQGEWDYDFVERALQHDVVAFLSKDIDIQNLLDYKFKVDKRCYNSPKKLKKFLVGKKQ
jgi:hypothetical protein